MKKHLKNGLYLVVFAVAGILFQISCSNSDNASLSTSAQNKVVFLKRDFTTHAFSLWVSDYDGSNTTQIPVVFPANLGYSNVNGNPDPTISPDGQKVFFRVFDTTAGENAVYSCDIDGSNLQLVTQGTNQEDIWFGVN